MTNKQKDKFVAFSFCWADLLFELDRNKKIVFFSGAIGNFPEIENKIKADMSFRDIIAPQDWPLMNQLFAIADEKGRINSQEIHIKGKDDDLIHVMLSGYILDDIDNHYFFAMRVYAHSDKEGKIRWQESEILDAKSFSEIAAERIAKAEKNQKPKVGFISLPNIKELKENIDTHTSESFERALTTCLKHYSLGGDSAAQVAEGRYSILHSKEVSLDGIKNQIKKLGKAIFPQNKDISVESTSLPIDVENVQMADNASVLTNGLLYIMKRYQNEKDFSFENFSKDIPKLMCDTVTSVLDFRKIVETNNFIIAFQPIINVNSGAIHHFEALCRFSAEEMDKSPYEKITFGEEAGLIQDFDIA
ncbi:MAG: EAL domain-containing protein, partial [Alphaproteobacteria bacterium]|nr:EAL domain-containing protein [Alphaproteobacteria bacterium]